MKLIYIFFTLLVLTSCNKDDDEAVDYSAQNDQEIQNYLSDNNLAALKTSSGLYYLIETDGAGARPNATSNVTVNYKGYFTNGSVFDQSSANGASFNLQQVIAGWTEGIPYFKEGGRGKLFIPAHLGYGSTDRSGIPAGSVLIFDVYLISVN